MRSEIESEMLKHADEELSHAVKLIDRIIRLGGTPVLSPDQWMKNGPVQIRSADRPVHRNRSRTESARRTLCNQARYQDIADFTSGIDYTTAKMAVEILEDELEHEQDIISFQRDITSLKKDARQNDEIKQPGYGHKESRYLRDSLSCCRNCGAARKNFLNLSVLQKRNVMKYLFLHYPKCGTCIKAAKWLRANGIDVEARDITLQKPDRAGTLRMDSRQRTADPEILQHQRAEIQGTEPERKMETATREELLSVLASDGKLVKRPLLAAADFVLVGFDETAWRQRLAVR